MCSPCSFLLSVCLLPCCCSPFALLSPFLCLLPISSVCLSAPVPLSLLPTLCLPVCSILSLSCLSPCLCCCPCFATPPLPLLSPSRLLYSPRPLSTGNCNTCSANRSSKVKRRQYQLTMVSIAVRKLHELRENWKTGKLEPLNSSSPASSPSSAHSARTR